MVNSRLLIAPEAAPWNWLLSEAAALPWMDSSMKPVSPRRAVLKALGKDTAQTHLQTMQTGE